MKNGKNLHSICLVAIVIISFLILFLSTAFAESIQNDLPLANKTQQAVDEMATYPTVIANFSSNVAQGYVPLYVKFTDESVNATRWYWDFGDNTNSTSQNPTHTYSEVGSYIVTLNASNPYSSSIMQETITINKLPDGDSSSTSGYGGAWDAVYPFGSQTETQSVSPSEQLTNSSINATQNNTQFVSVNEIYNNSNNESTVTNTNQSTNQTMSSNTSGKDNKKTPDFHIAYGILCLLCVFLYRKR